MSKVNANSKYKTAFNNSISHFINHNSSYSNIYDSSRSINSFNQNSILQNYNKNQPQKKVISFTNKSLINDYCGNNNRFSLSSSMNMKEPFDMSSVNINSKLKQKLLDINDTLLNKRRKNLHNNIRRSSSLECKAKDILKYSPSQRFILNSSLPMRYKNKKNSNEMFTKDKMDQNNIQLTRKKNEIEHYQYINEINKIALNKNIKKQYDKM